MIKARATDTHDSVYAGFTVSRGHVLTHGGGGGAGATDYINGRRINRLPSLEGDVRGIVPVTACVREVERTDGDEWMDECGRMWGILDLLRMLVSTENMWCQQKRGASRRQLCPGNRLSRTSACARERLDETGAR